MRKDWDKLMIVIKEMDIGLNPDIHELIGEKFPESVRIATTEDVKLMMKDIAYFIKDGHFGNIPLDILFIQDVATFLRFTPSAWHALYETNTYRHFHFKPEQHSSHKYLNDKFSDYLKFTWLLTLVIYNIDEYVRNNKSTSRDLQISKLLLDIKSERFSMISRPYELNQFVRDMNMDLVYMLAYCDEFAHLPISRDSVMNVAKTILGNADGEMKKIEKDATRAWDKISDKIKNNKNIPDEFLKLHIRLSSEIENMEDLNYFITALSMISVLG